MILLGIGASLYFVLGFGLLLLPDLSFESPVQQTEAERAASGVNLEQNHLFSERIFTTRDGIFLYANQFEGIQPVTVLLIHGIRADLRQFNTTAGQIVEATGVQVVTLDLRGHGRSGGTPGDVEYEDQYVDDLEDVIKTLRLELPGHKIVLAGHSMGGGIALRYAQLENKTQVDGYLLFAPLLGWTAPTMRTEAEAEPDPDAPTYAKIHFGKLFGLFMLNTVGIRIGNHQSILFFNQQDDLPPLNYSYRSIVSMAPDDAEEGLKAVDQPLMVLVGQDDELFYPDQFEPLIKTHTTGEVQIISGANHNSIHTHPKSVAAVKQWMAENLD